MYVSDLIEYESILLKIGPYCVLISARGDDIHLVEFYCELLI